MKVVFDALMRKLEVKICETGDKSGKVIFEFRDEKQTFEKLNKIFKPDKEVKVMVEG